MSKQDIQTRLKIPDGTKISVHKNLNKKCWVVLSQSGHNRGRVIAYVRELTIDVGRLAVSEVSRQRAIREGVRNVHARIWGTSTSRMMVTVSHNTLSYNPFKSPFFYNKYSGEDVTAATRAHFSVDGKVYYE